MEHCCFNPVSIVSCSHVVAALWIGFIRWRRALGPKCVTCSLLSPYFCLGCAETMRGVEEGSIAMKEAMHVEPGIDLSCFFSVDVVDIFDARSRTWSTAVLSQPRSEIAATSLPPYGLALFGGGNCNNGVLCVFF